MHSAGASASTGTGTSCSSSATPSQVLPSLNRVSRQCSANRGSLSPAPLLLLRPANTQSLHFPTEMLSKHGTLSFKVGGVRGGARGLLNKGGGAEVVVSKKGGSGVG